MSNVIEQLPAAEWPLDRTHAHAGFSVSHMVVGTFRGGFGSFSATLATGDGEPRLTGTVEAASIDVPDENLKGHLLSPDFFDVAEHPQIRFTSVSWSEGGEGALSVEGDLEMAGKVQRVTATGTIGYIEKDFQGHARVVVELEAPIDRAAFGIGPAIPGLGDQVTLTVTLPFIR